VPTRSVRNKAKPPIRRNAGQRLCQRATRVVNSRRYAARAIRINSRHGTGRIEDKHGIFNARWGQVSVDFRKCARAEQKAHYAVAHRCACETRTSYTKLGRAVVLPGSAPQLCDHREQHKPAQPTVPPESMSDVSPSSVHAIELSEPSRFRQGQLSA
jgi:hypothetical protein